MASVYVLRNPLDPFERDHHEHEGPLIDLLQDIAPTGFDMPIRAFINGKEIDLSDLDIPVANDDIAAIIVTPGFFTIGAIIAAVVSSLVSLALSFLFAPKSPSYSEKEENPTYTINVLRNQTRLGQPIPVVYGQLWTTPDYASRPYRFFTHGADNWNQYLDMLVCVGAGEFEEIQSTDLKIGNTTLSDTSAVQIKQFHMGPARGGILSHQGKFGEIQKVLWESGFNGDAPVFLEACYTSPEVGNWEFSEDETTSISTVSASVEWIKGTSDSGAITHSIKMAQADYDNLANKFARNVVIATSTLGNTGSYYLGYAVPDGAGFVTIPIFNNTITGAITVGADTVSINTEKSSSARSAGPFWTSPNDDIKTNYLYVDFEASGGIYQVSSSGVLGGIHATEKAQYHPKFKIEVYDKTGTLVTTKEWLNTDTYGVKQAVRNTVGVPVQDSAGNMLPPDRYQVKVTAMHKFSDVTNIQNKTTLVAIRSNIRGYNGLPAYGDTTILAVRMRATNGIASQSQDQLRVRAKRRFTLLDGSVGVSSNPADVAADILTNTDYGASQPTAKSGSKVFLQWDTFTDCHKLWENEKTDPANYPGFNGVFSTSDTVWTALQSSLSVAVAKPVMDQGQVKISRDAIKPYRAFMFNAANITLDSLTATYSLSPSDDVDHIEVEYRDDQLMEPTYAIYPTAAELGHDPKSPQKIKLFGCTNGDYAAKYARLMDNRRTFQRKTVIFDTEMDGMLPTIGDRILVSSPQVKWGISGNVRFAKAGTPGWTLTLDALPDWADIATKGKAYIVLTDIEGRVSNRVEIQPTVEKDNRVVLQADPVYSDGTEFAIDISGARDPARFSLLLSSGESARDMEITSIEHQGGTDFTINAVHYEVKQDNTGHDMYKGVPLHMTKNYDGSNLI